MGLMTMLFYGLCSFYLGVWFSIGKWTRIGVIWDQKPIILVFCMVPFIGANDENGEKKIIAFQLCSLTHVTHFIGNLCFPPIMGLSLFPFYSHESLSPSNFCLFLSQRLSFSQFLSFFPSNFSLFSSLQ